MKTLKTTVRTLALGLAGAATLGSTPARAWDPATTQAGLTEKAALASSFHRVLVRGLGRPLGAFEPITLREPAFVADGRPGNTFDDLQRRLGSLDPNHGYRPANVKSGLTNSALAWLVAGAALEETPPERGRHHFFDPTTGRGLDDRSGASGLTHALALTFEGTAGLRQLATGTVFDLTGRPAPETASSLVRGQAPDGRDALAALLERSVTAELPIERDGALALALLRLGAVLAILEDLGEPAHVRNDFRGAYAAGTGFATWDQVSRFERFVTTTFGRTGVPDPTSVVRRPNWAAYFTASDGEGLAERTHRRFFSPGTIPGDVGVDERTTTRDVVRAAKADLRYAQPALPPRLEITETYRPRYLRDKSTGARILGYERVAGRVRFFMDANVFGDMARVLLPEAAGYAAGLIDHLFRGTLTLQIAERPADSIARVGELIAVSATGVELSGAPRVVAEDAEGRRTALSATADGAGRFTVTIPDGARKVAVAYRGEDRAGPFFLGGELLVR